MRTTPALTPDEEESSSMWVVLLLLLVGGAGGAAYQKKFGGQQVSPEQAQDKNFTDSTDLEQTQEQTDNPLASTGGAVDAAAAASAAANAAIAASSAAAAAAQAAAHAASFTLQGHRNNAQTNQADAALSDVQDNPLSGFVDEEDPDEHDLSNYGLAGTVAFDVEEGSRPSGDEASETAIDEELGRAAAPGATFDVEEPGRAKKRGMSKFGGKMKKIGGKASKSVTGSGANLVRGIGL